MNNTIRGILVSIIVAASPANSQSPGEALHGLGVEIGAGTNNLFWSSPFNIRTFGGVPTDRTHFSLTVNARLLYRAELTGVLSVQPFMGYNRFGGSTDPEQGIQDRYSFDALEVGTFALLRLSSIQLGAGFKVNRHLAVHYRLADTDQTIMDGDRSDWFTGWSEDVGLRMTYTFEPITISGEAWHGLSNLTNFGADRGARIYQDHFRILVGHTL
jgi:hypothetical protein